MKNQIRNYFLELKKITVKLYSAGVEVVIQWVPSHTCILENELVDILAKEL